ncbi:MAG TPA: 16S rRNA (guanine(966)-N(2))-methyltransferase RsmD [Terriglobales bacterium]|nr:16S rRNA (guanine(966)-N(2))-methyltransferase RsmD [Terriglobales bacterium]
MRVIAGKYRSRPLQSISGMDVRPTSDRLRETLFNVLSAAHGGTVEGTVWVDLFAGTGAVGIEALSRGANHVHFVESSKKAARVVRENLRSLGIDHGFEVIEREAVQGLRLLESQGVRCDVCFLDPPYRMAGAYEQTLGLLSQSQLIGPKSVVIAEHDKHFDPGEQFDSLRRFRKLQQGDASLSFYRKG